MDKITWSSWQDPASWDTSVEREGLVITCATNADAKKAEQVYNDLLRRAEKAEAALSARPEGGSIQALLPSGWVAVPVNPTIAMHNAAAFGKLYETPRIEIDDNNLLRLIHGCPDWSRVWRKMVEAAPSLPHSR